MCIYDHLIENHCSLAIIGNNYYGDEVRTLLEKICDSDEREAYILMDKVNPLAQSGFILRPGATSTTSLQLICELGVFGIFVRWVKFTSNS